MARASTRHRWGLCALIGAAALCATGVRSAAAQSYQYVAITEGRSVLKTGAVRAGTLTWQCKGNRCTITGPWASPAVGACQTLARQVGRVQSYGRKGAQLTAAQLAECNQGAPRAPAVDAAANAGREAAQSDRSVVTPGRVVHAPPIRTELVAETEAPTRLQGAVTADPADRRVWTCEGSTCRRDAGPTTVIDCLALSRSVGRIKSYAGPQGALNAQELAVCNGPVVTSFQVSARSGDDDLRDGSQLTLLVSPPTPPNQDWSRSFPVFHKLASHAYDTQRVLLIDTRNESFGWDLMVNGIQDVSLYFRSGQGGPFDSSDSWEMVELTVRAGLTDLDGHSHYVTLYQDSQTHPIHTFHDGDTYRVRINRDAIHH